MNSLEISAQEPQPKSVQSASNDPFKSDLDHGFQHAEEIISEDLKYPVLPRDTKNEALPFIPAAEVRKRDGKTDPRLWIVIDDIVYDCSTFVHQHPGGGTPFRSFAGKSCSWQFHKIHGSRQLRKYGLGMRVGMTKGVENPFKEPEKKYHTLLTLNASAW